MSPGRLPRLPGWVGLGSWFSALGGSDDGLDVDQWRAVHGLERLYPKPAVLDRQD
jgi:hypothetical protein